MLSRGVLRKAVATDRRLGCQRAQIGRDARCGSVQEQGPRHDGQQGLRRAVHGLKPFSLEASRWGFRRSDITLSRVGWAKWARIIVDGCE